MSHATGYAVLLSKRDEAKITILSPCMSEEALAKEKVYSGKLAEICRTHDVPFQTKVVKTSDVVGAILKEAEDHDLVVMGASQNWKRKTLAFGRIQDRVAKVIDKPVLMVRKVKKH